MSTEYDQKLDLARLENVRQSGDKIIARCPACAALGGDRKAEHLTIRTCGGFYCAAHQGDREHSAEILRMAGNKTGGRSGQGVVRDRHRPAQRPGDTQARTQTIAGTERERREKQETNNLPQTVAEHRAALVAKWSWEPGDVWDDSPFRVDGQSADDPRLFLRSLFAPDDVIWTGQRWQSGKEHGVHRWRTAESWQKTDTGDVGPLVAAATWQTGTISRTAATVGTSPFLVLDFDGPEGWKPADLADLKRHLTESRAIVRWLRDDLDWQLAAIVWTGSKSLHAWFHNPGQQCVASLRAAAPGFGIDKGLIGHPEHPARLPGHNHEKTGQQSRLLWLAPVH